MPKKPTGKIGFLRISSQGIRFIKTNFPSKKEEIEKLIVERFVDKINSGPKKLIDKFEQNQENDFDFTLYQGSTKKYLELMEIVPSEGGYFISSKFYKDLEIAQYIVSKIKKNKSDRYDGNVDLLIYPTDYKFYLSELSLQILGYLIKKSNLKFGGIFYFALIDDKEGNLVLLYPRDYGEVEINKYKDNITFNLDPEDWKPFSGS